MDAEELELLQRTITRLVGSADGSSLTAGLDDLGWLDLLATEPSAGVPAVFAAQGRAGTWSSALHDVLGAATADFSIAAPPDSTSVIVPLPRSATPGHADGVDVRIEGLLVGARSGAEWLVAASVDCDGKISALRVPVRAVTSERRQGFDPAVDIQRVSWNGRDAATIAEGEVARSWWTATVALARRALTHQLCGTLETMFELARLHAVDRQQFGRPIGSFQAVRHKLAESKVALAGAAATADIAWEVDDEPLASATAKLVASRACALVVAHTQQILAGVGFTADHPYHRAMKRALLIDRLFGDAYDLATVVGRELVARGDAPRLVAL
ncbi:MAG: hypothetical protein JWL83_3733 [Actinomycetia bacterium]|nr:hypothetical protein [Actinomycetes bacterium]